MPTTGPPREAPAPAARLRLCVPATAFLLYFGLLIFCDVRRPAAPGMVLSFDGAAPIVTSVILESPADRAGLRVGDRLLSADDRALRNRFDWLATELTFPLNGTLPLRVVRAETRFDTQLRLAPEGLRYWLTREGLVLAIVRAVQGVTLAAALLVLWRRPSDAVGVLGGWLLATMAVFTIVPPYRFATVWRDLPGPIALLMWLPHVSALAIGAVVMSFFAVFPSRWLRRPFWWVIAWTPMAVTLGSHIRFAVDLLRPSGSARVASPLDALILPMTAVYVAIGLILLVRGARRLTNDVDRRRTRVVLASSVAALIVGVPVVIAYWAQPRVQLSHSMFVSPWFALGTLWLLIFPLGFTYAILRHRLFDVPAIIRQGVQYALARRALVSVAPLAALALAADVLIHRTEPIGRILSQRGWLYAALVGFAVLARVRRDAWLNALDRQFFRERCNVHGLLKGVAGDIRRAGALETAARDVVARIDTALHPMVVAVLLRRAGAENCERVAAAPDVPIPPIDRDHPVLALVRAVGKPLDIAPAEPRGLARQLPDEARRWLEDTGIELIVPITVAEEGPDAVLVLGARRSEEPYGADEKDLLQGIADSLALVLDVTGDADEDGPMMECPECGRCEPPRTVRCPLDGTGLVPAHVPRRLGQRYLVERRLARGGMGTVYDAVDTQLGRRVAVKVLREDLVGSIPAVLRFEREARLVAAFSHPNIVVVHDFGVWAGSAYLVMERLHGQTLRHRLTEAGRIGPGEASVLVRGIAAGLDAAHEREIVHRDLKPENVFVVHQGGSHTPKILDFGIARLLSDEAGERRSAITRAGELFGTPDYMAPEQVARDRPAKAWDVWALAVMAYEMLTGRLPEDSPAVDLPLPLRAFFDRALAPSTRERPGTASQLAEEFDQAVADAYSVTQAP